MKANSEKDLNKIRESVIRYLEKTNNTSDESKKWIISERDVINIIEDSCGVYDGDPTVVNYYLNLLKGDHEHFSFDGHNFKVLLIPAYGLDKFFKSYMLFMLSLLIGGVPFLTIVAKKHNESLENFDKSIVTIDNDNAELLKNVYAVYDLDSVNFCVKRANDIKTTDNGNREVTYDFCDIKTGNIIKSDNDIDYFAENLNSIYDISIMEEKDFNITYDELNNEITLDFLLSREPGSDITPSDFAVQKSLVKKK